MSDQYGNVDCPTCWPHDDTDCICEDCFGTGYVPAFYERFVPSVLAGRVTTLSWRNGAVLSVGGDQTTTEVVNNLPNGGVVSQWVRKTHDEEKSARPFLPITFRTIFV